MNLKRNPSDRILELGGGDNPNPNCDVNVDVRSGPKVHFTADFDKPLPIKDEDFQGVFSQFVIEHLSWRAVKAFLKEVYRIITPGSPVVFITANTEAQLKYIAEHGEGWDGRDGFDSASCILFGDQNYPENAHKNFMSPTVATKLFMDAGFDKIAISPFGAIGTDMVIQAEKPVNPLQANPAAPTPQGILQFIPPGGSVSAQQQPRHMNHAGLSSAERAKLFDRSYFNGRVYQPFYWDAPSHETLARKLLARKPESVLELGCGRGYVLKKLHDAGVKGTGIDISLHAWLTRATDFQIADLLADQDWDRQTYDLCYSLAFWEYVPEELIPKVAEKMRVASKRGLHGIVTRDDGGDPTRCTLRSKEWWQERMPPGHEVHDANELEGGELPEDYLKGDGKVKLNLGCAWTMFHQGWMNMDVLQNPAEFAMQFRYLFGSFDARKDLPHPTETVDLIFCCHMLEHLNYKEGLSFLRECRRVLKPDGGIRILVPNAALLQAGYANETLSQLSQLNEGVEMAKSEVERLWNVLYEAHLSAYDAPALIGALAESGFEAKQTAFRQSAFPVTQQMVKECLDMVPSVSLIVDAVPKTA